MSSQPLRLLPRMEQSSTFWCSNLYQPPRSAAADNHLFAIFALACGNRSRGVAENSVVRNSLKPEVLRLIAVFAKELKRVHCKEKLLILNVTPRKS
ncbi:zinc finger protein [Trichonephila clavipes]|nr:zinc finger protein [Trichonephila clavipes]